MSSRLKSPTFAEMLSREIIVAVQAPTFMLNVNSTDSYA
jgi:hypothetical protein